MNNLIKSSSVKQFLKKTLNHKKQSVQLGLINNQQRSFGSKKSEDDSDVILIVPNKGTHIMGWGSNDEGQLGLNNFSVKVSTPMFINSYWFNDKDIKKISVASSGQH